jgi:hypothetical protein
MLVATGAASFFYKAFRSLPVIPPAATGDSARPALLAPGRISIDWSLFRPASARVRARGTTHADKRYRLIGTFSIYSDGDSVEPAVRRAIVADDEIDDELIVGEGEVVGEARIIRVFDDHVTIGLNGVESDLWLSIVAPDARHTGETADAADADGSGEEVEGGAGFGELVGERLWVMQRDRLMDYYRGLLDEPNRLLAVFDSMKPVYGDNRRISGYVLEVAGEGEFFESMGLQEGDVVRRVNAVPMTSRSRAEYFIRQFAEKGGNAFVFEVERDGAVEKHVYQIR